MLYQATPTQDLKPLIAIVQQVTPKETPKAEPITYTFKDGDILEDVASAQHSTVKRLFNKNPSIVNPDQIKAGETIEIPTETETLTERPLPAIIQESAKTNALTQGTALTGGSSSSGNTYTYGYCTWLVKNLRPDLPNNLGDAWNWLSNAQRDGLATSNTPHAGAVGVAINYGHVVYVEAVHGSTISLVEMNFVAWNVISRRDAPISEFRYIL